jgi:iron(III) transport system ATP-binding protein
MSPPGQAYRIPRVRLTIADRSDNQTFLPFRLTMFITVNDLAKQFVRRAGAESDTSPAALGGVSLSVARGCMLALVGPSGSGKTTLLRCLAGLERPDRGSILFDGREVFCADRDIEVPTEQRKLGLIFQSYALWPHLTAERNVAYPLKRRGMSEAQCRARVAHYLDLVGCGSLGARFPHELSGGQQQRIALARALVYEPSVVLFDEPLSNLDPQLREHLRAQIREIQRSVGFTGVYVTHDQTEAFFVGDEVAILDRGLIAQSGTPEQIYRHPASPEVAAFVGASNGVEARIGADGLSVESSDIGTLKFDAPAPGLRPGGSVRLMLRPEALGLRADPAGLGVVVERIPAAGMDDYAVRLPGGRMWRARVDMRLPRIEVGSRVALEPQRDALFIFPRDREAPRR